MTPAADRLLADVDVEEAGICPFRNRSAAVSSKIRTDTSSGRFSATVVYPVASCVTSPV